MDYYKISTDGNPHKPKLFKVLQEISEVVKASQDQRAGEIHFKESEDCMFQETSLLEGCV